MIRTIRPEDYDTLVSWWVAHKFVPYPPRELLPSTGYMANEVAAGFLYLSNAPIAWMEWVVTDPNAEKASRSESVDEVIEHISKMARMSDSRVLFTATPHPAFPKRLRRLGFVDGDTNTNHFVKALN